MRYHLLILGILFAVPAFAQEPSAPIKSAETVTAAANHPIMNMVAIGDSKPAPTIYPDPRPTVGVKPLGTAAREIRAEHAALPKAKTVASDELPIKDE